MEWRGVPLRQALTDLADRLGLMVVWDSTISPRQAETPIRMQVHRLRGDQVLRWLARYAGLEAVIVEQVVYVAPAARLPTTWRAQAVGFEEPSVNPWPAELAARQADIHWLDVPLSMVSRNIAELFGVDMIVSPEILRRQELVHLNAAGVTLADLADRLSKAFETEACYLDGALWLGPPLPIPPRPASMSARSTPVEPAESSQIPPPAPALQPRLRIDRPVTCQDLCERITRQSGLPCLCEARPNSRLPPWEADGTVGEILAAARMVGLLDYEWRPEPGKNQGVLVIRRR